MQLRQRARPAPAADRPAADLRRGQARADSAHGLSELEPVAFPRHGHLDHGQPANSIGTGWLGRYLDHVAVAGRSAGGLGDGARSAALADRQQGQRAGDSEHRAATRSQSPNGTGTEGRRSRAGDDAHRVAPAAGQAASVVRQRHHARGARDARPRGVASAPTTGSVTYGNDGLSQAFRAVAGAMVPRHRHEGVLGHDRRLRHARHAEHERRQRRLLEPDGHDQHGADDVLQRPAQSGPAAGHRHSAVLGVRPAHQRERQRRAPTTARPA